MAAQIYIEVLTASPATVPFGQICSSSPSPYSGQLLGMYPAGVYALPSCPKVVITIQPPHKCGHVGLSNDSRSASSSAAPLWQPTEAPPTPSPKQDTFKAKKGKEPEVL